MVTGGTLGYFGWQASDRIRNREVSNRISRRDFLGGASATVACAIAGRMVGGRIHYRTFNHSEFEARQATEDSQRIEGLADAFSVTYKPV